MSRHRASSCIHRFHSLKMSKALRLVCWAGLTLAAMGILEVIPTVAASAKSAANRRQQLEFFENRIRPVLVEKCYECHSARAKTLQGNLRLDTRAGVLRGGDLGPAIVAGNAAASLLIRALRYEDEALAMPPAGRLPESVIADFVRWINMGAPDPRDDAGPNDHPPVDLSADDLWSFAPNRVSDLPAVNDAAWARSPIDRFILARLEAEGLAPSPPASPRELIRRATYDLIGLPPTLDEIAAFLADERVDAFECLVERLLTSPHYGERWGRHWLDVARYADSNGVDENLAFVNAFRYRDYVIGAFNADKPFDRFIHEQLAGDLLPAPASESDAQRYERLTATGFLSIGPKMLACDDGRKMELDIVDEQLDTTARAFLGLTIGCARCHDHKFDPISTADYYSLAGIFKSTKTMENFKVVAQWHEHALATPEELAAYEHHNERIKALEAKIEAINKGDTEPQAKKEKVDRLEEEKKKLEASRPELARAMGVREGKVEDLAVHIRGNYLTLGEKRPRQFPVALAGSPQQSLPQNASGRLELARWLTAPANPLTARVIVNRLWLWHFGDGLVRSPDNFGRLGEAPTHPELLDWLARRFVDDGWSMKAFHRLVMNSATYRMSTRYARVADTADPENRLLWRFPRRRLGAEELRDALLMLGGRLDRTLYGQLLAQAPRSYVTGTGSKSSTYDFHRRSIYLPILRSAVYQMFQVFDFSDPSVLSGKRASTTIAPQALFLMNSRLVSQQTEALARRLLALPTPDDRRRLQHAFESLFARRATASELDRYVDFLHRYEREHVPEGTPDAERRQLAWQSLCRVLVASSEFLYLE